MTPAGPLCSPRLSVVIPTCNRAPIVIQCLRALARQALPADQFEVLVCDDASTDGTMEALAELRMPYALRLFRLEQRGGPGKARNLLIRQARAPRLVILNDDAMLSPAGLAIHAEALEMTAGQNIAVLGKFTFPTDYQKTPFGFLLENTTLSFRFPIYEPEALYGASGFYSCNLGIHKAAIEEAGMFDEGYAGAGAEDMELGDRLAALGHAALYLPQCQAVHEHRMTIRDFCRSQVGRGAGGVARCAGNAALVFHYDAMDSEALAKVRAGLDEASPAVERLLDVVHALHLRSRPAAELTPAQCLPWLEAPLEHPSHEQWRMPPRMIARQAERAAAEVLGLMRLPELGEAAMRTLYQACSFLKWRFDTIGVARSPLIEAFAADSARRRAARLAASIRTAQAGEARC